jgi:hypothetical protein
METFAERFCNQRGLPPEQYRRAMLQCCVHRRALIVLPLFSLFWPGYFAADYELITGVGLLKARDTLDDEIHTFYAHPDNRSFPRHTLRIRISIQRLKRVFGRLMKPPAAAPVVTQVH